ncbi:MAG TPA: DUF6351 family protein [Anaeromyxobacteraceae bacterium]|nr:DUF6351 family protein [Anaeromyxobacteraceae bacterium]
MALARRVTALALLLACLPASPSQDGGIAGALASGPAPKVQPVAPPWTPGDPRPPGPPWPPGEPHRSYARFWIGEAGPTGPIFSGPQQVPFICSTFENGLGQPLVDNQDGVGNAVFPEVNGAPDFAAAPVGWSRTCSIPTRVGYFYFSRTQQRFLSLANPSAPPPDADTVTVRGRTAPFVVRLERGTINRFIYGIAMLVSGSEPLDSHEALDKSLWSGKLVYSFQGGVGIGRQQGSFSTGRTSALHEQALRRGHAVAYSTGNITGVHYNLALAGETAMMVKDHFVVTYGRPDYTLGVGGSGGAIQQYVIAQNLPGLLDGLVPQFSYSDMITQTIYVGDCELLERFFDMSWTTSGGTSRWGRWGDRRLVEGMNTSDVANRAPWNANPYAPRPGSSECINGWRGLTPLVLNPAWAPQQYFDALRLYRYPESVIAAVKWDHWDDLGNIYPKDELGYALQSWDNVGVQYGLRALQAGALSPAEFLELNACVGGWKKPREMTAANAPWNPAADPRTFDPWSMEDMTLAPGCAAGAPAPRTEGSLASMQAAYGSGHVFLGRLDLPIVDLRHYLEPVLDMHHAQQSFATRQRMLDAAGHADNQVIWFAECSSMNLVSLSRSCAFDPTGAAFDVLDRWIATLRARPQLSVAEAKPSEAVDACFAGDGTLIYRGADAWSGILEGGQAGPCTARFPLHTTSRIEAGAGIRGDVFKCALKPVDRALADGTYGGVTFTPAEAARLQEIFPGGVCDWTRPDVGRPWWLALPGRR